MSAASLTGVMERRVTLVPGMAVTVTASVTLGVTSVTASVTDVVTLISPALRRIRPVFSHALNRRMVRILFQPH
jgi:hypothetical protein